MIVLDASALLAFLFREDGHHQVAQMLGEACISTVNLAEVIGRFVRDGHRGDQVLKRLVASPLEVIPFSAKHAGLSADLIPKARPLGLSLGDRACLALAQERNIPAWTADRSWSALDAGIAIKLIR